MRAGKHAKTRVTSSQILEKIIQLLFPIYIVLRVFNESFNLALQDSNEKKNSWIIYLL